MEEYSQYDTIAEYYFDLVAFFMSMYLNGAATFETHIEIPKWNHRIIKFKGKEFNYLFPDITVIQDFSRDGTPTKPETTVNGNFIGREPIWGIDELRHDDDFEDSLDKIMLVEERYYKKMYILNKAIYHLNLPVKERHMGDSVLDEVKNLGDSKWEFVRGAQWYADFILERLRNWRIL